jgi:hypothetical protein
MLNQPAAKDRPNRGGDGRKSRPSTDGLAATFLVERGTDNREAPGHQQCSPHTLNAPRDDQLVNVEGNAAS